MGIADDIIGPTSGIRITSRSAARRSRSSAQAVQDEHPAHFEEAAAECGSDTLIASLTFIAVAGRRVQLELFNQFDVPINLERVLHRDQKLIFHRPIKVGDRHCGSTRTWIW